MTEFEERELDELIQVRLFLRDNRHLRFEETPDNFDALGRFLDEHSLPVTAANLRCAYEALVARGELELMPLATDAPIPQPTIPQAPQSSVQTEPESERRLHAAERRPGESAWIAARRAYAEQQISAQRKARQEMRAAMQAQPARRNQSREINNLYAAVRKPRGKGAALIVDRPDWKME